MNKAQVKELQGDLNRFTGRFLEEVAPIMEDGVRGHATDRRIVTCKFYLGYTGDSQRSTRVTPRFREQLGDPKSAKLSSAEMVARGEERRRERSAGAGRKLPKDVARFDGRPVAAWLKPYLDYARENGWKGTLVSGYRDAEQSEQLCVVMCGAPSCPGRCAGRKSNHTASAKPKGAVDVSDFARFGELMNSCPLAPRIFNGLGERDPVHFSADGR